MLPDNRADICVATKVRYTNGYLHEGGETCAAVILTVEPNGQRTALPSAPHPLAGCRKRMRGVCAPAPLFSMGCPKQLNPKIAVLYESLLPEVVARTRIGGD